MIRPLSGSDPPGEATDVPGAYRVGRVDDLAVAEGRIWPQSRGSQLAGLVVGARDGERVLDLCAAPGGKTTQLHGEVTAVNNTAFSLTPALREYYQSGSAEELAWVSARDTEMVSLSLMTQADADGWDLFNAWQEKSKVAGTNLAE